MNLVRQYLELDAERQKFDEVTERITAKWQAKRPMPDALRVRPGDAKLGLPCQFVSEHALEVFGYSTSVEDMRKPEWCRAVELDPPEELKYARYARGASGVESYMPSPEARARADEIVAAYEEWFPKRHPPGSRKREARSDRMFKRLNSLEAKINKKRARTIVGLLAKGYIASIAAPDPDDDPAIGAFLRDCRALAKIHVPCIAWAKVDEVRS
jgi:hypothetical protein